MSTQSAIYPMVMAHGLGVMLTATSHRQGQIARCAVLLREANIDCVGIEDAGLLMVMIK